MDALNKYKAIIYELKRYKAPFPNDTPWKFFCWNRVIDNIKCYEVAQEKKKKKKKKKVVRFEIREQFI